jgi:methyl-accepting chemotaxis protein
MERAALRPRGEAEHAKVHAPTDSAETSEHVVAEAGLEIAQASSVLETINLLESDFGAMIGDVLRLCAFVCHDAEDSAAASDKITAKSDTLAAQAGSASRDLTQLAAAIEELARSADDIGHQVRKADDLTGRPMNRRCWPVAASKD